MGGVSVGIDTGTSVSDGVGVIMDRDRDRDRDRDGVLKNGFGILNFAEAPNLFRPRGGIYRGEGGW